MMWGNLLSHVTGQETPPELPEFLQQGRGLSGYPIILVRDIPLTCRPLGALPPTYPPDIHPGLPLANWQLNPRAPWEPSEIHTVSHKSQQSVPVSSQASPCSLFHRVDSSLDCPSPQKRTCNLHPSTQPYLLRNMLFCLTRGPFVHLPSISLLPQVALQPLPAVPQPLE